jgi:hypothetical protein
MKGRVPVVLLGLVLFGLGNLSGVGLSRWYGARQLQQLFAPDNLARHRIVKMVLSRRLALNAEQESALETILTEQDRRYILARSECEPAIAALRADLAKAFSPHLTPEQNQTFHVLIESAETFKP